MESDESYDDEMGFSAEQTRALRNYEKHYGIRHGGATINQVIHSSAGIKGWGFRKTPEEGPPSLLPDTGKQVFTEDMGTWDTSERPEKNERKLKHPNLGREVACKYMATMNMVQFSGGAWEHGSKKVHG